VSFLDHIAFCNRHDLGGFRRFLIDGQAVGWVTHGFAERLAEHGQVFRVTEAAVELAPGPIHPGMLDNTVASGQPVGIGFKENLVQD